MTQASDGNAIPPGGIPPSGEATPTGAPVVIICIGNTLRRDDGVAWAVAERLEALASRGGLPDAERVRIVRAVQLLPEHADDIAAARLAIIVDASVVDAGVVDAGTADIGVVQLSPVPDDDVGTRLHALSPSGLRALVERVYGAAPPMLLCGIPVSDLGYGESLSDGAAAGAREAERLIEAVIRGR
jgi:hydrogenase maturation protease